MDKQDSEAQAAVAMAMLSLDLEHRVETLNRYKEGTLSVGETSCVDRCCSKYWQIFTMVGQMLGSAPK